MSSDETCISPTPWIVEEQDGVVFAIRDKNGKRVVETDSGFYPPNLETAKFIVECVNSVSETLKTDNEMGKNENGRQNH